MSLLFRSPCFCIHKKVPVKLTKLLLVISPAMIKNSKIGIRSKWVPFFLKSLLLLLHSHRADLGPDTGEGKTQKNSEFEAQDLWNRELASRGETPPPQDRKLPSCQ